MLPSALAKLAKGWGRGFFTFAFSYHARIRTASPCTVRYVYLAAIMTMASIPFL